MAKVCGLTSAGDVALALDAGADLLGFLAFPASPRHCPDLGLARRCADRAVLVAVAGDAETMLALARRAGTLWVQPYLPPPERARALALLRVDGRRVLLPWPDEPGQEELAPDLYLWESSPRATGLLGGSGQGHPMAFPPPGPFLLGGGLDGAAVPERLERMTAPVRARLRGFDAASRLESAPGRKDPLALAAFVGTAHGLPGAP
jgi:phosphoribosylanthranilate isomerase